MSLYTANWLQLGSNINYRRIELYSMKWKSDYDIDLNDFHIKASSFAGPIG